MVFSEDEFKHFLRGQVLIRKGGGGQRVDVRRGEVERVIVHPVNHLCVDVTIGFAWLAADNNADKNQPTSADWYRCAALDCEFPSGTFRASVGMPHGRLGFYSTALLTSYTFFRPDDPELLDRKLVRNE